MLNNKEDCVLFIIKFLYNLSLKYPYMNTEFDANGVNSFNNTVNLYGDIYLDDNLSSEIKSLELMMIDKPKKFKFISIVTPTIYFKSASKPRELNYYFNKYRKELRSDKLNNLLDDE